MEKSDAPQSVPFAFFGTPYVARDTLAALLDAGYVPTVVVTSPDARKGRGLALEPCETKEFAMAQGLPVLTPHKLDEAFLTELLSYKCRYAVVVAYGKLLPQKVLDAFPLGLLNVHYSLLPKYRGAAPVEYALLSGDRETGVTIQKMVLAMDAGDMLAQAPLLIEPVETTRELRARLIELGSQLLIETLQPFLSGTVAYIPQDESQASFSPKIPKEAGLLSLSDPALQNWHKYRAYAQSPGTYFFAHKEGRRIRIKVKRALMENDAFTIERIIPEGKGEQDFSWLSRAGWVAE